MCKLQGMIKEMSGLKYVGYVKHRERENFTVFGSDLDLKVPV